MKVYDAFRTSGGDLGTAVMVMVPGDSSALSTALLMPSCRAYIHWFLSPLVGHVRVRVSSGRMIEMPCCRKYKYTDDMYIIHRWFLECGFHACIGQYLSPNHLPLNYIRKQMTHVYGVY